MILFSRALLLCFSFLFFFSCRTIDVEKSAGDTGIYFGESPGEESEKREKIFVEEPPPEIVVVERPVYIPEDVEKFVPEEPHVKGREAVRKSNVEGIIPPEEYSRAAMVYDYDADWVYEVYTQPLRVSDIRLEAGEKAMETPFISDSERWLLGAGVSYEQGNAVQHIYVKPVEASLEASLIINTDRRVYHVILKSFKDVYMPMVRWKYFSTGFQGGFNFTTPSGTPSFPGPERVNENSNGMMDPRYISLNYRIRYGIFRKPPWLPSLVYDDGKKTYITFPKDVLQSELPAVFDDRDNIVNYRVMEHVAIIDKLIEKITVRLDGREIIIEKKKGGSHE